MATNRNRAPRGDRGRPSVPPSHDRRHTSDTRTPSKHPPKSKNDGWDDPELTQEVNAFIEGRSVKAKVSRRSKANLIEVLASEIKASWYRCPQANCDTGLKCAQAEKRLGRDQKKALLEKLPFSAATFSKLVQIGNHPRLSEIIKDLPPSFSSIYTVTTLSNKQLDAALDAKIINGEATREDIERFRNEAAAKPKASPTAKSRAGQTKALDKATSTGPEVEEEDDDLDFLEDDEEEDEAKSEESKKTNTIYQALLAEWKGKGLIKRNTWLATPPAVREKIYNDVLRREPFKPNPAEEE